MLKSIKPSDSIFDNSNYQKQKKEYSYFDDLTSQKKIKKVKSTDDIFTNETNEENNIFKINFIPYLPKIKSSFFLNKKHSYLKKTNQNLNNNIEKIKNNSYKENNLNYLYLQYNGKEFENKNHHIQYMKIRPHELIESLKTYSMPTDVFGIKMVNYVQKFFDDDTYKNNSIENFMKEQFSNQPCKITIKELVLNEILNNVISHCIEIRDKKNKVITREIIYDELKLQIENARNNLKIIQDYMDLNHDINNNNNNKKKELEKKNHTSIYFIENSDKYNYDNNKINNNNIQGRKIKKGFITSNLSNIKYKDNKNFLSTNFNNKKISPIKKNTKNNLSSFENPHLFFHFMNLKDNLKSINSIETNQLIKFICDTPLQLPKINPKKNRKMKEESMNTIPNKNENNLENKMKGINDEDIEDKKLNNRYEFLQKILNNDTLSSKDERNQPSMSSIKSTELQITAKKNQISQTQNSYMNDMKNDFHFVQEQSKIIGRNIVNKIDKKIIEIDNCTKKLNQKDISKLEESTINKSINQTKSQNEQNENIIKGKNINLYDNKIKQENINSNIKKNLNKNKINIKEDDEDLNLNTINDKKQKQKINEINVKKTIDDLEIKNENERKENIDEKKINKKEDNNNVKIDYHSKDENNFLNDLFKKKEKKEKENSQNTSIKHSNLIKNNNKNSSSISKNTNLNSFKKNKGEEKTINQPPKEKNIKFPDELNNKKQIEIQNSNKEEKDKEKIHSIREESQSTEINIKSNSKRHKKNKIYNETSINNNNVSDKLTQFYKKKGILKKNDKYKNKKENETILNHSFSNPIYIPIINIKKSLGMSKSEIEFELRFLKKDDNSINISRTKIVNNFNNKYKFNRGNFDLQLLKSIDSLNKGSHSSYSSLFNFSNEYHSNSREEIYAEKKINQKKILKQKLISNFNYFDLNENINENEKEKENENKNMIKNKDDNNIKISSPNFFKFIKNINEMKKENPNDYVRKLSKFIDDQVESEIFERKKKEAMINGFKYNLKENFIQKSKLKIYNAGKGKIIFKPVCIFENIKIENNENN